MTLKIDYVNDEEELIVAPTGDLDITSSPELKTSVLDQYRDNPKNLVFDLENLEYLDSTGLGAFISIYKNLKENDHSLTIRNARPSIKKLFTITELDSLFTVED